MKTYLSLKLVLISFLLISIQSNGQWLVGNLGPNFWGETDPNNKIDAIGIGDYTGNSTQPAAALDITIPYLFNQGAMLVNQGEAIRSSAASDFNHTWKMYTFPETEKFRVENPSSTPDINLSVMQEKGILRLNTTDGLYGLEKRFKLHSKLLTI